MTGLVLLLFLRAIVPDDLFFAPWFVSRGVAVEIARTASGPPWVRGTSEIPAPAGKIAETLRDFEGYGRMFSPAVKSAAVLARTADGARLHLVWAYPFPYRNRDAVVAYRWRADERGFTLEWKSDSAPGDPKEGVRISRVAGETRVEPLDADRSRVTYTYLGDLGGHFPAAAQEKAWREEPVQYMRALRRRLGLPDAPPQALSFRFRIPDSDSRFRL